MAVQNNNLVLLDENDPFLNRTLDPNNDEIEINVQKWTFQNDVQVDGNLTVNGTVTSIDSETLVVEDNNILLNSNYTTVAGRSGGLTVNYLPIATADSVAATGFTAGVAAVSNPTVVTAGSGTFAAGQFILITGADDPANNGLFEVLSHVGTTLTIRGVGTTATVEDFTQNQFVTDTTVSGTITHINVSVLRAGTDGLWEQGLGATTPISFTDLGTGTGNSLQQAYVVGNTISTSAPEGDVIVSGTESLQVTATGGLDVDTVADFDVTTFDVQMTGSNGFSIDGTAASNVTVDAGDLTVATTTSGNVVVSSADAVDVDGDTVTIDATTGGYSIDGVDSSNLSIAATTAGAADLTISATNAGAGTGNVLISSDNEVDISPAGLLDVNAGAGMDVDVAGNFDMLATGTFSIDGTGASNVTATSGDLTVSTATSGNVVLSSAGDIDGEAVNVTMDATAGISLDAVTSSNFTVTGNSAGAEDLTLSATNVGAGTGNVLVSSDDEIDLTSGGLLDINAGANFDLDVTGTMDFDSSGAFSIDGTGASNVTATSGDLTLSTVTSGGVNITSIGDSTYTVPTNSATAFRLTDGTDTYINVDSTNGAEAVDLDTHVNLVEGAGIELTTSVGLVAGNVVSLTQPAGELRLADGDTGTLIDAIPIGISRGTFSGSSTAQVFSVPGSLIPVLFGSAPAASDNGKPVFVSSTAGEASLTPPTGSSRVIYVVGYLQGADGVSTTPNVIFQPQYIGRGPSVS